MTGADVAADKPDLLGLQRRFNRVRGGHRAWQRHGLGAGGDQRPRSESCGHDRGESEMSDIHSLKSSSVKP